MSPNPYSPLQETTRIFQELCNLGPSLNLPSEIQQIAKNVTFTSSHDQVYFPIPFKETETSAALKALEASIALCLYEHSKRTHSKNTNSNQTSSEPTNAPQIPNPASSSSTITVSLEAATCFLFQAYQAKVQGLGKLDLAVKPLLKDTDLLAAQSNPYRRMAANLYRTSEQGRYYHIHGSLEASTQLQILGLASHRPELVDHDEIVAAIEPGVQKHTVAELEDLTARYRQAGVEALKREDFLATAHGKKISSLPPWSVEQIETLAPPTPLPTDPQEANPRAPAQAETSKSRILQGVKVLELCRIIAGPTVTRILAEYGADVLKITSPNLPDVPFFQVDGNMGKRAADLDLKSSKGREVFEGLLAEADVLVDGYRPGALDKLGYGPAELAKRGKARGKGYVVVNENCFGFQGEWAHRAGWQQIADCVTGLAWAQGRFLGREEPVVPPFPISDYGTGCMGAIAALSGLYWRAEKGGSWWGGASLCQYDLFLMSQGEYDEEVKADLKARIGDSLSLRYHDSVDGISGRTLKWMQQNYPWLFEEGKHTEKWDSQGYKGEIEVVRSAVEIEGGQMGFQRASRPNGTDQPTFGGP